MQFPPHDWDIPWADVKQDAAQEVQDTYEPVELSPDGLVNIGAPPFKFGLFETFGM